MNARVCVCVCARVHRCVDSGTRGLCGQHIEACCGHHARESGRHCRCTVSAQPRRRSVHLQGHSAGPRKGVCMPAMSAHHNDPQGWPKPYIYCVYTVFLAGMLPYKRSSTVTGGCIQSINHARAGVHARVCV